MVEAVTKLPVKTETADRPMVAGPYPFDTLRREVERLFAELGDWPALMRPAFLSKLHTRWNLSDVTMPAVDIAEKDGKFEISVELPGVAEKDIEVKLVNGGLSIKGTKQQRQVEKKTDYVVSERSSGSFERYFTLPDGIELEKIEATLKNGILTLVLPKTAQAKAMERTIAVKAA